MTLAEASPALFGDRRARNQVPAASAPPPGERPGRAGSRARRRRYKWLDRLGWYEFLASPIPSTTRQIAGLNLATTCPPTSHEGIAIGQEQHSGWPYFLDQFTSYTTEVLRSSNILIIGDLGLGKSSLIKTWAVLRALALGRRVVVIDKKLQRRPDRWGKDVSEGEYAPVARAVGVEPIRFVLGKSSNGSRINILDPAISGDGGADADGGASQHELLRAVLCEALGRSILPLEGKALRVAHKVAVQVARQEGRDADIRDIVTHMESPSELSLQHVGARVSVDMLAQWGQEEAAELDRLVNEDLAGLIDGPTSPEISLTAGLTVFDISSLPDTGPAVPIVMAIVNTWLRATLENQASTVPTIFVGEEGWHLVDGSFAKVTQRNHKVSRGIALSSVIALHHISDIPADSPAIASIKESGIVVLYRQEKYDDALALARMFNLPPGSVDTLMELPVGSALFKVSTRKPVIVTHMRSAWEIALTNTDDAMNSRDTMDLSTTTPPRGVHAVAGAS